jgi:hypothetical protein
MRRGLVFALTLLGLAAWAPAVVAEEAKAPINAAMLLSIMAQPGAPSAATALDESLRDSGPPPRATDPPAVTITVRNPCPPGDLHYEPRSLPGRRARP